MRVLYIYNQHNAKEVAVKDKITTNMKSILDNVSILEMDKVKDILNIRATPALIIIRDDLQGEHLIEQDEETNNLKAVCELAKAFQEEDLYFRQQKTERIEEVVKSEIIERMGDNMQIMNDMFELLNESGVI